MTEIIELQQKYEVPQTFQPSKLMEGIEANAAPRHLKKEYRRVKVQEDLCPAQARNAAILTILETKRAKNDSPTLEKMESLLCESCKLTANAVWQGSVRWHKFLPKGPGDQTLYTGPDTVTDAILDLVPTYECSNTNPTSIILNRKKRGIEQAVQSERQRVDERSS